MRETSIRRWLTVAIGMLEAALVGRLVALLLAANPDNPFVAFLLTVSAPLVAPLAFVDAHQPVYGSRFERSAVLMVPVVACLGYLVWRAAGRLPNGRSDEHAHNSG